MLKVVKYRNLYFAISLVIIIPGIISLLLFGLRLGVDFTGGTLLEYKLEKPADKNEIIRVIKGKNIDVSTVQITGNKSYLIRTKPLSDNEVKTLATALQEKFGKTDQLSKETIGPTIGKEMLQKSILALVFASIMIVIYIGWAFRSVPKPASSLRFGITAVITLLHDVLVLLGVFSLLGHFYGVEVDSLFVTATLTVIGFSVHDTIVVFDRIRENLNRQSYQTFDETVDHSVTQTLGRSLNTSLTVVFVLLALLLFGGASVRWFVFALLIGIVSGTYSSIFNAAPLLTLWQDLVDRSKRKK